MGLIITTNDRFRNVFPIILLNGKNLDMDGWTITCNQSACANSAIEMKAGGSKVINLDGDNEAVIDGPFVGGVNCELNNNTFVDGITIRDVTVGVKDCKKVWNNVIGRSDPNNL